MQYQKEALSHFAEQIRFAIKHYESNGLKAADYDNIILSGLGGSGIAGRIAKSYFFDISNLPIEVISDYTLPAYAGKKTLAIMSSYSGNTEETLSMYEQARAKGCQIVAISTGGKLTELAKKDKFTCYKAETGFQPRMALGYSLTYLLLFFGELFNSPQKEKLEKAAAGLSDANKYIEEAEELFGEFKTENKTKLAVITDYFTNPVGLRFCQQVQENAKGEAFLHELPESNHNVIESYYGKLDSVFIMLNSHVNDRTSLRFHFLAGLLRKNGNHVIEIDLQNTSLTSILETIYTLDWLSLLISDSKGIRSNEIPNINELKEFLSER